MATHRNHTEKESFYFVTFTCYEWLPLIERTCLYDYMPICFSELKKRGIEVCGYVIMPNHIHLLVFVRSGCKSFNKVIGESKRFMAYEIVKRLRNQNETGILKILSEGVQENEQGIGKKHQVFRLSFDAKVVEGEAEIFKVLDYMHHNPVSGKWNIVDDFTEYQYSSASHYELNRNPIFEMMDYRDVFSELKDVTSNEVALPQGKTSSESSIE